MSGTKSNLTPVRIALDADLSADYTSAVTTISFQDNVVYQVNVKTGTPVGVLDVQTSTDYNFTNGAAGNWTSLGAAFQATVNGTGTGVLDLNQVGPCFVRLKYTRTSGTGTMDIFVSGKQV